MYIGAITPARTHTLHRCGVLASRNCAPLGVLEEMRQYPSLLEVSGESRTALHTGIGYIGNYIGIMEKKMETTIGILLYRGSIGVI